MIQQTNFIQQPYIFNSVTNLVVLSNFSFMSHSIVPHIQPCNKFNCFISFYILIYFKSVQFTCFIWFPCLISFNSFKYSTFSKIKFYYLFHIHLSFNTPTYSTLPHIQQDRKFSSIILFLIHISFNSPTYSTM